ncbi:MAG: hypothetical protein ACI8XG_000922, partial [Congregibacter sp.]
TGSGMVIVNSFKIDSPYSTNKLEGRPKFAKHTKFIYLFN